MKGNGALISLKIVESFIKTLATESSLNKLPTVEGGPIFDQPLVGVADGQDSLFTEYKRIIGDFHLAPTEVLQRTAEVEHYEGAIEDTSVVCWVLPFAERIRSSNAMKKDLPASPLWAAGQEYGEKLNDNFREQVALFFRDKGYLAVAPVCSTLYIRLGRYVTNWSERHVLYAAGMGTFGLSRWLITERGVAMRCGSVVVNAKLTPTPRRYASHTENCLFYSLRACSECIDRCPAKAITTEGLNKVQCREYLDVHAKAEGCGLCQTGVPCESKIPTKEVGKEQGRRSCHTHGAPG